MAVPEGAHDSARQIQLDVVNAVLDLLSHGVNETVRVVALAGVAGGQEVPAGSSKKIPASKNARPFQFAGGEDIPPGHVHKMARSAAQSPARPGCWGSGRCWRPRRCGLPQWQRSSGNWGRFNTVNQRGIGQNQTHICLFIGHYMGCIAVTVASRERLRNGQGQIPPTPGGGIRCGRNRR